MKQLKLLSALLMCLLALNFTACGGEDEEKIDPTPPTETFDVEDLYGGWKYEVGNECFLFYFSDEDNTGIFVENANSDNYDRCDITYKVNSGVTTLTVTEEDGDKERYTILSLTNKKLVIEDAYDEVYTLKRYNGDIDEEYPKLKYDIKNLYGGWEYESDYDCCLYYFSPEDNTGIFVENANSKNYDRCDITYKLNSSLTVLTITEEDGDKEKYTIVSLTSKKLVLEDEDGDTYTLKRYNGNIDEEYPDNNIIPSPVTNSLIGIWKYTFSSGASYVVFKNDGTCETFEIDLKDSYNAIEDIEATPYTYNSTTMQLCLYEDGDKYYYSVKSLTTNNMTIVNTDGEIENWVKYNGTLEDIAAEYRCIFYYDTDEYEEDNMLYATPYLQWGSSPSTVKNKMSSKGYTLLSEDSEMLVYLGKYHEDATAYTFEYSSLYGALILLDASKYTLDNILEHLDDVEYDWNYIASDGSLYHYFKHDDNSTYLVVSYEDDYWMLTYVSASDYKAAASRAKAIGKRVR